MESILRARYTLEEHKNFTKVVGMSRVNLYELFNSLGFKEGCEVGVWQGKNAFNILQSIPNVKLTLVDPYTNHPYVRKPRTEEKIVAAEAQAYIRLEGRNVLFLRELSEHAVMDIPDEDLDFVYIDGEHHYDQVMLDLILWSRKVRSGGILCGHDYFKDDRHVMGVVYAVNDYARIHNIKLYITDIKAEPLSRRSHTSWFWEKK